MPEDSANCDRYDEKLAEEIREKAGELGFCRVGFTTMEPFGRVREKVRERAYPSMFDKLFEVGTEPKDIFPLGKSIIVLARDYSDIDFPESLLPHIARAYLSRSYLPIDGSDARTALDAFEAFLMDKGVSFKPDGNVLNMRAAAERAGVIAFGHNNFAYVPGVGSFVILYGYLVDAALEPADTPAGGKCPEGCHACIDACPTKALYAPYKLDIEKCILFNNAIRAMRSDPKQLDVPAELRDGVGVHIHGCDECQAACPRNAAALHHKSPRTDPLLEHIAEGFSLDKVLHMPEGYYEEYIYPIMYNYISDPVLFQRNAAIAMGNSGDRKWIPDLTAELDNESPIVREHVRWALDKLQRA
ncbi:MAG: epoxyqueuosine reductase [Coriobacteriales bacterium]|jgi:epoxyqueuosine reductase